MTSIEPLEHMGDLCCFDGGSREQLGEPNARADISFVTTHPQGVSVESDASQQKSIQFEAATMPHKRDSRRARSSDGVRGVIRRFCEYVRLVSDSSSAQKPLLLEPETP